MPSFPDNWSWRPPAHWRRVTTVEMHTGGEPLRVLAAGLPPIEGATVLEKRRYFREHYDALRTGLMWEPRGHADMYGAVLLPSRQADFDVFFLHNEGYSTMCGHAIIALTRLVIETALVPGPSVTFSVPAGTIAASARLKSGIVVESSFRNVPSFVLRSDLEVAVPGLGRVRCDVAYGGAFYALVEARTLGLEMTPEHSAQLIDFGRRIKQAVIASGPIEHPFEPDLSFLYGTIFTGPAHDPAHHSRNVCIFADGELDRSATGSGVSARCAVEVSKGRLPLQHTISIESILGSTLSVRALERARFGPHDAVIPEVGGSAFFTGRAEYCFDPEDPCARGFLLR